MPSLLSPFAVSAPFEVTSLAYDPVWLRCMEEVRDRLKAMATAGELPGIAAASVKCAEQPYTPPFFDAAPRGLGLAYPGILVWPFQQEQHNVAAGPNDRDEIIYPVAVSFIDKGSGSTGTGAMIASRTARRHHMLWREKVSRRFRFGSWPAITEVRESNVRYQLYAIPELYRGNDLFHGAVIVEFTAWETRDAD